MSNSQIATHYFNEFQKIAQTFSGQQLTWLNELRQQAMEQFKLIGLPKRNDEQWKYANLTSLEAPFFATHAEAMNSLSVQSLVDVYQMVFVDGHFAPDLSQLPAGREGVMVLPLSQAWHTRETQIRAYLEEQSCLHSFSLLNTSFVSEGVFVELKQNLDKPLHIVYLGHQANSLQTLRNIFILAPNSEMTVIEEHRGNSATYFKNEITQVSLAQNARLNYCKVQNEAEQARHISQFLVKQQRDSSLKHFSLALGGCFSREDIQIDLAEKAAEVSLQGLYICGEQQYMDHHTQIHHRVAECRSQENYRGILSGQAVGVFNGKVVVHPQAQKTQATQSNQNLLLSRQAEINTKPELEIYADDVKCAHGATVGELEGDALFYLRSRGIDEVNARILLTQAFAQEIVETIATPTIKNYLYDQVMSRLTHLLGTQS